MNVQTSGHGDISYIHETLSQMPYRNPTATAHPCKSSLT